VPHCVPHTPPGAAWLTSHPPDVRLLSLPARSAAGSSVAW
jgi:hypothetical protein